MPGLGGSSLLIVTPRRKHTYSVTSALTLGTFLDSLPAGKNDVLIDGLVPIASQWKRPTWNVNFEPLTADSGFQIQTNGEIFAGDFADAVTGWSPASRGTVLTQNIAAYDASFIIPAGVVLAVGDWVVLSSNDIIPNIAYSGTGHKPCECHRVEFIDGTRAYTSTPIRAAMTTANQSAVKPAGAAWADHIEFNGISFLSTSTTNQMVKVTAKYAKFEDCIFHDPAPAEISCRGGEVIVKNCRWLNGLSKAAPISPYGVVAGNLGHLQFEGNSIRGWYHEWVTTSSAQSGHHWDGVTGVFTHNKAHAVAEAVVGWSTDAALDLHPEGADFVISFNELHVVGRSSVATPTFIRARARNTTIEGNVITGIALAVGGREHATTGIEIFSGGNVIKNNTIRNCLHGIVLGTYVASNGTIPGSTISGNTFDSQMASSIEFDGTTAFAMGKTIIHGNTFRNNRGLAYTFHPACHIDNQRAGAQMEVTGNVFEKSAASHSSINTVLGVADVEIVGNTFVGFTSGQMGLSGTGAADLEVAYAGKNFGAGLGVKHPNDLEITDATKGLVLKSTTPSSVKRFRFSVDDAGTLTTTEI